MWAPQVLRCRGTLRQCVVLLDLMRVLVCSCVSACVPVWVGGPGIRSRVHAWVDGVVNSLIISNRCAELRFASGEDEEGGGGVQIQHTDVNVGFLAPLVGLMYTDAIEAGFGLMTRDLRKRLAVYLVLPEHERPRHVKSDK